ETNQSEKIRYYPFPILTTSRNFQILETRFNCQLISLFDWYDALFSDQEKGANGNNIFVHNSWSQSEIQIALRYLNKSRKYYCKFFMCEIKSNKSNISNNSNNISIFFPDEQNFESWLIGQRYFYPIFIDDYVIWLIPSGHVIGACSLCISKKSTILVEAERCSENFVIMDNLDKNNQLSKCDFVYYGEYYPIFRGHCLIPPPIQSKHIVLDMLYGDPRKIFPSFTEELTRLKTWIINNIKERNLVFFCHQLGKPQLILEILCDVLANKILNLQKAITQEQEEVQEKSLEIPTIPLILPNEYFKLFESILPSSIMKYLKKNKILLNKSSAAQLKIKDQSKFILLEKPRQRNSSTFINFYHKYHPLIAEISGWCGDLKFREEHLADEYFEITDHFPIREATFWLKKSQFTNIWITNNSSNLPIKYLMENLDNCHKSHLIEDFTI
ncbi:MAG: hypothetical protein ACTSWC_10515, partial [Promethearchaeota archaeon]